MAVKEILDAIEIICDEKIKQAGISKTYIGTVSKIIDSNKSLYELNFGGGLVKATSISSEVLSENEQVYFQETADKKRFIIAPVDKTTGSYVFEKIVFQDKGEDIDIPFLFRLNSWKNNLLESREIEWSDPLIYGIENNLAIKIQALVTTDISMQQLKTGIFGICVEIPLISESGESFWQEIKLISDDMRGNPFSLANGTLQDKTFILKSSNIDFRRKIKVSPICCGFIIDNEAYDNYDIELTDIKLFFGSYIENSNNDIELNIKCSQGTTFSSQICADKTLEVELITKGKISSLGSEYDIKWFKSNDMIDETLVSQNFSEDTVGWELIGEGKTIKVKKGDFFISEQIKCVVVSKNTRLSKTVLLKDISTDAELVLEVSSENLLKDCGDIDLKAFVKNYTVPLGKKMYFFWNRWDKDEVFIEHFKTVSGYHTIPSILIEDMNFISVTALELQEDGTWKYIASKRASVFTKAINSTTIDLSYPYIILYDENGLNPKGGKNGIVPLEYHGYKDNGEEFSESEYKSLRTFWGIPKSDTLIEYDGDISYSDEHYNYYKTLVLPFKVSYAYSQSKTNNNIKLVVKSGETTISEKNIEIICLKQGDNGTNGTDIVAKIYPANNEDLRVILDRKTNKLYENGKVFSGKRYVVKVFKNGILLPSSSYSVAWEMFDSNVTQPCLQIDSSGYVTARMTNAETYCNIIKATVTLKGNNYCNTDIRSFLGIPYFESSDIAQTKDLFIYCQDGFDSVLYESDGTAPAYNQRAFKIASSLMDSKYDQFITSSLYSSSQLETKKEDELTFFATPIDKFDNGDSKNFIRIKTTIPKLDQKILTAAQDKLRELEQKNERDLSKKEAVLSLLENIKLDELNVLLEKTKPFLLAKEKLIRYKNAQKELNYSFITEDYEATINKLKRLHLLSEEECDAFINSLQMNTVVWDEKASFSKEESETMNTYISKINKIVKTYDDWKSGYDTCQDIIRQLSLIYFKATSTDLIEISGQLEKEIAKMVSDGGVSNDYSYNSFYKTLWNIKKILSLYSYDGKTVNTSFIQEINSELLKNQKQIDDVQNSIETIVSICNGVSNCYYIKPIVMLYNAYGMSNINAWDGNKVYTGGSNGEYILAPQIGAGRKERDNSFTGIIGGLKSYNRSSTSAAGLFGYNSGTQVFCLNAEDGSASFGRSGSGQINIRPYGTSDIAGWLINEDSLSKSQYGNEVCLNSTGEVAISASDGEKKTEIFFNGHFECNNGRIGLWNIGEETLSSSDGKVVLNPIGDTKFGEHFKVTTDGDVTMNSGTVGSFHLVSTGLYCDDKSVVLSSVNGLKVTKGNIAGWKINEDSLTGGKVTLEKTGALSGAKWSITAAGKATFEDIAATGGVIGNWKITEGKLTSSDSKVVLNPNGTTKFGDNFKVTVNGNVTMTSGTVGSFHLVDTGLYCDDKSVVLSSVNGLKVTKGNIGGWKINDESLTGGEVTLSKTGALSGASWSITAAGKATFGNLVATGGSIGGWKINGSSLTGGNVTLNKTGALSGTSWSITAAGKATFSNINATGGVIAISGSGTTINGSSTKLTESKTSVGSKNLGTYVKDLTVDTLKASKIKTSQLEADTINGKSVSWVTTRVVTSIKGEYNYAELSDTRFVNRVSASSDTIDGKSVITSISTSTTTLPRGSIMQKLKLTYHYTTMTLLSTGASGSAEV